MKHAHAILAIVFAFAILITCSWAEQNVGEEFPLGVFGGSYTDEQLALLEQLGFNYVFTFGVGPHTTYDDHNVEDSAGNPIEPYINVDVVVDEALAFLRKAKEKHLKVAFYINTCKKTGCSHQCNGGDWIYYPNAKQILGDVVNGIKNDPDAYSALGFWVLSDEPTQHCVNPEFFADSSAGEPSFYSILKETGKPVANVQCDCSCKAPDCTSEFNWGDFSNVQDIIMPNRYPVWDQEFPDSSTEVTWDGRNITIGDYGFLSRAFSQSGGNDVIPMYQCYKHGKYTSGPRKGEDCSDCRCPQYEEVRYWLFSSLAVGARGVFFYSFTRGYQGCGGADYFNTNFKPALQEVDDFLVEVSSHEPTAIISGKTESSKDVYLSLYERPAATLVVFANNSETARTLSLNIGSEFADSLLQPWGQTRNVSVKSDATGQFSVEAEPFEVFVWKACEPSNNGVEICDSIDNDCDGTTDEDNVCNCGNGQCETELGETFETCPADCTQQCIREPELLGFIGQWKRGEITMLTLMQKMRQRKAGTGCPPGQ